MTEYPERITPGREWLFIHALNEIAESIGSTTHDPISLHLFCLTYDITFDELGKILVAYNTILRSHTFEELNFSLFKDALIKECKAAKNFHDDIIAAFIIVFAKWMLIELRPFAAALQKSYPFSSDEYPKYGTLEYDPSWV
ncbi:hypothetical protein GCM10007377_08900 [Galliscardovia ingluviei]|uniref:Uncharacterized protein n=1 Tax=Galliscardovia ingluviei TaxID=1769422 RepID=A0A8J3F232_9BIFI|nr:hypothetical protein [Galliscardovia ingluviei]GGI14031.1 hypothetical protein GCM10007377_08900 [Galliscardovia ingluviei]